MKSANPLKAKNDARYKCDDGGGPEFQVFASCDADASSAFEKTLFPNFFVSSRYIYVICKANYRKKAKVKAF